MCLMVCCTVMVCEVPFVGGSVVVESFVVAFVP